MTKQQGEACPAGDTRESEVAKCIEDVPTRQLATNFVCSLIQAKGNINEYQVLTELLIRELRHEPHPELPVHKEPTA